MLEQSTTSRAKQAVLTTGANGIASLIKLAVIIVATPYLIDYLGSAKYGLVMTILSICIWINTIADAGIVNGFKNEVIKESAKNSSNDKIKTLTSTTFFFA